MTEIFTNKPYLLLVTFAYRCYEKWVIGYYMLVTVQDSIEMPGKMVTNFFSTQTVQKDGSILISTTTMWVILIKLLIDLNCIFRQG